MSVKDYLYAEEYAPLRRKIAAGAAALLVLTGCWHIYRNAVGSPAAENDIPLVRTVTAGSQTAEGSAVYPGEVRGRYESRLAFQVTGKIDSRPVSLGDHVAAGQVLMTIDPKDIRQNYDSAQAQLFSARANYKLAADNAERYRTLYAGGAVSRAVLDQYSTQQDAAGAALRQAEAQARASANQMEYTRLRSDADGVVASVTGEVGQVAAAGSPVITVIRSGSLEVQINVPENALSSIKPGLPADISFWALPGVRAGGFVREIAPMADSVTKTYKVCVAISDMPPEARLGMTAKVSFAGTGGSHITLPAAAIYKTGDETKVWVVRGGRAQLQDIAVAGYDGNNVIIASGLEKGDTVVTAGISKLIPGQQVRLAEEKSGDGK